LQYENKLDTVLENVTITETVPAHTVFAGPESSWSCEEQAVAGRICTHTMSQLAANESRTVPFSVRVIDGPIPAGVEIITNNAAIGVPGFSEPDSAPENNIAVETTVLDAAPDLSLIKSDGGASAKPGDVVAYTLTYENKGGQGATGVIIMEQIPANTTFNAKASAPGWDCTNATCSFTVGALAAGERDAVDFAVQIITNAPAGATAITNTASIADDQANGAESNENDNVASDTTLLAIGSLTATKQATLKGDANGNGEANPGDRLEYIIEIRNNGNRAVTGIALRDTVDRNTTLVANSVQANPGVVNATNPLQITIGELAAGARATIRFQVTINSPLPANVSRVENQATVTSNEMPAIATDDPSAPGVNNPTRTPVVGRAALVLTKMDLLFTDADNNDVISPGDRLLYRMKIANQGDIAATNVVLKDTPDSNTTLVAGTVQANMGAIVTGNQPNHTNVEVSVGTLLVGQVADVGFLVEIPANMAADQITNQATVTYGSAGVTLGGQSDDPDTNTAGDATVTTVVRNKGGYLPLVWK
jgi:uncharacterized repeat protein (TIGR01451 family)